MRFNSHWSILLLIALILPGCTRGAVDTSTRDRGGNAAGEITGESGESGQAGWIDWRHDYQTALTEAQETDKPLMVDVFTPWCTACKLLDQHVWPQPDIVLASKAFIAVKVDADKHRDFAQRFSVTGLPTIIFLSSDGKELHRVRGAPRHEAMMEELKSAAEKAGVSLPESI
jgi:thiol:disulfide interchange protein